MTALRHAAEGIVRRLRTAGFEAVLAGGCVRDRLLGLEPSDYDIATSARPDQVEAEIYRVLDFTLYILKTFGFTEYEIYLSTRPEKFVGTPDRWELATNALEEALKACGLDYQVDPGEGVTR